MSALRVQFFFDEEASNWHFRVPALHINGGGAETRAGAERPAPSSAVRRSSVSPSTVIPAADAEDPGLSGTTGILSRQARPGRARPGQPGPH